MRTNWIRTIEKLLIIFEIQLSENKIKFKANNKKVCHLKQGGGGGGGGCMSEIF